jgi:RHS repeat-associated protein
MHRYTGHLFLFLALLLLPSLARAQAVAPPALAPAPLWSGNFPGDPENWPSPDAACKAQHDYYNPGATLQPASYNGGQFAGCNWTLNANSNTILPALASAHCPSGYQLADPGICLRGNADTDSRAQCGCPGTDGSPQPTVGNPVALNYSAKVDDEVDYASAEQRFSVDRRYYSLGEDYTNVSSPTAISGFGARWHGVVPGRLAVSDGHAGRIEYLAVDGSFAIFSVDSGGESVWTWHTYGATRRRLSMVSVPSSTRPDFFYAQNAVANGVGEVRMDMSQGEYILFRRAGPSNPGDGIRYLVPVEHGWSDGYKIFYAYPDTGEFPNVVSDSLGHQMTLTWADAPRETESSLSVNHAVHVISKIDLPDGTSLNYTYGKDYDVRGSRLQDRLEGVQRLTSTGALLWGRTYLYENSAIPYALTGKVDQNGNRLSTYTYDAAGLVTSTELAGGFNKYQIVNLEDTSWGASFIRQVTNPLGYRQDYTFFKEHNWADAQRVLKSVTNYAAMGVEASTTNYNYYGYVGDMAIADYTDEKGLQRHFDVDGQLRPTLTREASGTSDARTTNMTWDSVFDLPKHEERPGLSIDYTYSPTGLLLTKTETDTTTQTIPYSTAGQTRTWTFNWNGNGRLLSVNGPKGLDVNGKDDLTTFTYDSNGNLLTSTNALGHVTHFANYDANGRPGKMTDPNGIDTLYSYDQLGRVATVTVKSPVSSAGDAVTTFDYDAEGRVIGVTLPGTSKMAIDRDLTGQVTAIRSTVNGEKIAFTRDPMGNVTLQSVKRYDGTTAREISRTFDGLGRLLTETLGTGRTSTLAYDKLGNVTSITSARSFATTRAFDSLNRLVSSVAPDTGGSATAYDGFDRAKSFTDPKSVQTTFVRDGFGDVIQEVSPDRGNSTYYFDAAGAVTASIDGRGQRVDIVRDALGRILSKTPVGRPASEVVSYYYDLNLFTGSYGVGRLGSTIDGTGKTQFGYDHRGNVTIKRRKSGATVLADLSYTYDNADRVVSITYPSGRIVNYTRNLYGRVTAVATRANASAPLQYLVSGITYEPFGSMLSATYGNGLLFQQSWGNDGRLASRRLYLPAGTDVSLLTYAYDNDDNITSITDNVDPTRSVTYGYDAVGRLTQSVLAAGSTRRQDLIYDTNSNLQRIELRANPADIVPASTTTYSLNAGTNQLASVVDPGGTRSISYDGRGNTIGETRPSSGITVAYDGLGRLTSYQVSGGDTLANEYNGLDDRITGGTTTDPRHYVYDLDGRMMGEYGSSYGDVKAETIWLSPTVSSPAEPFGGDDGMGGYAPLAVATPAGLNWVYGNHLGVPILITDNLRNVVTPGYTLVGFPGQTRTLVDLYYNRYRDYDPTTGRYIQADPIGLMGGRNPYLYANGNPLRFSDPSGRNPVLIGIAIGIVIDLGEQLWEHRDDKCWRIDWWRVVRAGATGGLLGGAGAFVGGGLGGAAAAAEAGGGAADAAAAAGAADGGAAAGAADAAEGGGALAGRGGAGSGSFSSSTNAAGGQVYTSTGNIAQNDFAGFVNSGLYEGDVHILTGVHGLEDGSTIAERSFYDADMARFGDVPGVQVHDITTMTPGEINNVLNGPGTAIGGFCNSAACLAPFR